MKRKKYFNNTHFRNKNKIDSARKKVEQRVKKRLITKYDNPISYYHIKLIDDILYNEQTRFVGKFKEILIYDDTNEFLKSFYNKIEIIYKLPKILTFYDKYSKIYANYTAIPEKKYMYKNIKRKQKLIEEVQNINNKFFFDDEKKENTLTNKIFTSNVMDSINSFTMSLYFNTSNNKTKTDTDAIDLVVKIDTFEKQVEMIKKNIKNNEISRNYYKEIKKKKNKHTNALSNNIINSLINNNTKYINEKLLNSMNKSKRNSNKISVGDSLKTETFFFNNTSTHEFNKKKFYTPSKTKISKKNIDYHSPSISINQSKKNSIINKLVYNKDKKKVEINNSVNCHSKVFSYKNKTIKKNLNLNINKGLKSKLQYSHLNTINSNQELLTQSNNEILKTNINCNNNSLFNCPTAQNTNSNNSPNKNLQRNLMKKSIIKNNSSKKYSLKLRKNILNNYNSKSSSTDRNTIKTKFNKITKHVPKESLSKIVDISNSNTPKNNKFSKDNSKILNTISKISVTKNNSSNKKSKKIFSPSCNSSKNNIGKKSIQVNLGDKFKTLNLQKLNNIKKNIEDTLVNSERINRTKNYFK